MPFPKIPPIHSTTLFRYIGILHQILPLFEILLMIINNKFQLWQGVVVLPNLKPSSWKMFSLLQLLNVYAIYPNEKSRKAPKIYLWDDNIDVEIFKTTTNNPDGFIKR